MILIALAVIALLVYALVQMARMQRPQPRRENRRQYVNGAVIRTGHLARVLAARRALGIGEPVLAKGRAA